MKEPSPRWLEGLLVAFVVGSILNIINQGNVLFSDAKLNSLQLILTYLVPFFVYQFGQWRRVKPIIELDTASANDTQQQAVTESVQQLQALGQRVSDNASKESIRPVKKGRKWSPTLKKVP